jgi:Fe/S biogenesis protein NfuA
MAPENTSTETESPPVVEAGEAPIFAITPEAMTNVLELRATEDRPESYALRIEITGSQGVDFRYDLAFDEIDQLDPSDERVEIDGLVVAVPAATVPLLRGAELGLAKVGGGFVIRNPNRPDPLAGLNLELSGELPERVQQVLDQSVNPSLAEHGGFATLVGVDDNRVFITMGGGCQGCSMSRMTLTEGIQRTILAALPEVTEVIDATDHTAGENPFF